MFKKVIVLEVFTDSFFYSEQNIQDLMAYYDVTNSYNLNRSIPPNTIIGVDADKNSGKNIKLYFPFFSHTQKPIKVGEWAWVFNDENNVNYSYWLSRIVAPANTEDSNYTHNDKQFLGSEDLNHLLNGDRFYYYNEQTNIGKKQNFDKSLNLNLYENKEYENLIKNSISENFIQKESIPKIIARPGEHLIEGSNNSYILLGTDRTINKINASIKDTKELKVFQNKTPGGVDLSLKSLIKGKEFDINSKQFLVFEKLSEKNIGCIDIVAGKVQKKYFKTVEVKSEDNKNTPLWSERDKNLNAEIKDSVEYFKTIDEPNFSDDKSRIFISERTNLSNNFKLNWKNDNDLNGIFATVSIKSDNVLNIGRKKVGLLFQENENSLKENCSYVFLGKDIEIKSSKEANISMTNENVSINLKGNKISIGNNNDELIKNLYSLVKVLVDNATSTTLSSVGPTTLNPAILSELQKIILSLKRIGNV